MNLNTLLSKCSEIVEQEFKIKPEKSTFQVYSDEEWEQFLTQTNSPDCFGVYLPRSLSAHLKKDSEFLQVNFLHEFFGHGLFCEHSLIGQKIVNLEQEMADIEKQIWNKELPKTGHFTIDETNPHFQDYKAKRNQLIHFVNENICNYEGFAMWLEYHLANKTGIQDLFDKKMDIVHSDNKKLFEQFKFFEEQYGKFILTAQLGFPKYYDKNIIIDTLKKLYKKDFESIDLCILYGSKKPYSDIDLFIISDKIKHEYNDWLDIYSKTKKDFEDNLNKLAISVTDPIFSGELIIGGEEQLKTLQEKIINMPITQEVIGYNLKKSDEQGKIALTYPENSKERKIALGYQKSYQINAEELQKGNKLLTKKNTIS